MQDEDERRAPSGSARLVASDGLKSEGGHPCGRPSASSAREQDANPTGSLSSPSSRSGPGK